MPKLTAKQIRERRLFLWVLQDERKTHHLSQAQLAAKLNRPQSYISKIESGERKISFLELHDLYEAYDKAILVDAGMSWQTKKRTRTGQWDDLPPLPAKKKHRK